MVAGAIGRNLCLADSAGANGAADQVGRDLDPDLVLLDLVLLGLDLSDLGLDLPSCIALAVAAVVHS